MDELAKKLEKLKDLIKAIRQTNPVSLGPKIPAIPAIKPPSTPSMVPSGNKNAKISSGAGPDSKKDPRKIAEQIKNGSMSTKTQKAMLKADSVTGQWYLEPTDPSSV